ncbi:sulfatase-like hydrolase/transferase [Candidatus Saccharibacteria bacterium]|nr:sulfatase-like hydrolase/transferase [Candidatus Saccharibacteria bacterium]
MQDESTDSKNNIHLKNAFTEQKNLPENIFLSLFLGATCFIPLDLFFLLINFKYANDIGENILFVVLLGSLFFLVFFAIFKSSFRALLVCYSLSFLIGIINQIKVFITNEPVYLTDVQFLTKLGHLGQLITANISLASILIFILIMLAFGGVLLFILFVAKKFNISLNSLKYRIPIIGLGIVSLMILFMPLSNTQAFFLKVFTNNNKFQDYDGYGTNLQYYLKYGFIGGLYGNYLNNSFHPPKDYDETTVEKLLAETIPSQQIKLGRPDIYIIFSESFWDLDQLDEISFNQKITKNFNSLKEKGFFINTISPSYGGMSENVAFEFLTGGSMNFFPQGYIPVNSLYSTKNAEKIPSLVKALKNNGYNTKTTFVEDYYQTEKTYKKMGFDTYLELARNNKVSDYNDEKLTNLIIDEIENNTENLFSVYSTFENHMPFSETKYNNYDIEITKSNLNEDSNKALRSYAQGIYNSDKQLSRLYEKIQQTKRPILLIFISDHLPYLYNSNLKNVFDELSYFNTNDEKTNLYRKYNTQCLILSNYTLTDFDIPKYYGVDQILSYIVNRLDLSKKDNFYSYLESSAKTLPAFNRYISLNTQGELFLTNDLADEMKNTYVSREMIQYKLFINR